MGRVMIELVSITSDELPKPCVGHDIYCLTKAVWNLYQRRQEIDLGSMDGMEIERAIHILSAIKTKGVLQ